MGLNHWGQSDGFGLNHVKPSVCDFGAAGFLTIIPSIVNSFVMFMPEAKFLSCFMF